MLVDNIKGDCTDMEIRELVELVNKRLEEPKASVAKVERELGMGKDSIRQRLKRNGYTYNKELKQFINVNLAKDITQNNTKCLNGEKDLSIKKTLTEEEIDFVKNLYKQHLVTQKVTQDNQEVKLITRSIRVEAEVINSFANYCKKNNIKQSTALKIALQNFMNQ